MSETPPFKVGDVVNGHRWNGTIWEPVVAEGHPRTPQGPPNQATVSPDGRWQWDGRPPQRDWREGDRANGYVLVDNRWVTEAPGRAPNLTQPTNRPTHDTDGAVERRIGPGISVDDLVGEVGALTEGLTDEEATRLFGAAYAATAGTVSDRVHWVTDEQVADLARAVNAGRKGPCPWCGERFTDHTLTVTSDAAGVWCADSPDPRSISDWIRGPQSIAIHRAAAILMWVGIPAFSFGLLSWVPATAAAIRRGSGYWARAAAVLGALTLTWIVMAPADGEGTSVLWDLWFAGVWVVSMVFGALQVKPWLAGSPKTFTATKPDRPD